MSGPSAALEALIAGRMSRLEASLHTEDRPGAIPEAMTFRDWCESMKGRLKVDNKPWRLATLAQLFMSRKFSPCNIASFVPDQAGAQFLSTHRWMPVVRSCPDIYRDLVASGASAEGSIMTRAISNPDGTTSLFRFMWTSGAMTTESFPADVTVLDEVQGMEGASIDKVRARMGDSDMQFTMMLSTPNNPSLDINEWYLRGHQAVWHTRCQHCEALSDLSDPQGIFPDRSIVYNGGQIDGAPEDYVWICPVCSQWIKDPQQGEYVPQNPDADPRIRSFLLPRTISPRITARDAIVGFNRAKGGEAKKSFYNRTLARPYINVDELPVTREHCDACIEEGRKVGLAWERKGEPGAWYGLGLDQMGSYIVALVIKRMADGRPALVWAEAIYSDDPFERCGELMDVYNVAVCVVEQLPNVNDARRFANKYRSRVFLAGYAELRDDVMLWGDDPINRSERHTAEDDRTRWTVVLNQYKCMMKALYWVRDHVLLMPPADELEQLVLVEDGSWRREPILHEALAAFGRTALVVVDDPETRRRRAKVIKIGADPHWSYALMCAAVGWSRAHGSTMWILPSEAEMAGPRRVEGPLEQRMARALPGIGLGVLGIFAAAEAAAPPGVVCGRCQEFTPGVGTGGLCQLRQLGVGRADIGCAAFAGT